MYYCQTPSTTPSTTTPPKPKKKTPDKVFDPTKDKPKSVEPGTATPINWDPVGHDAEGNPIYDDKNKDAYNCHSYAWEEGTGDPEDPHNTDVVAVGAKKWDNDPTNNMKGYKQLDANAPNQEGDRVIYYVDQNHNGKFDKKKDKVVHSAIVTKVDAEGNPELVRGKMGQNGLSTNHPRAPGYYDKDFDTGAATSRAYFRKEEKKKKK